MKILTSEVLQLRQKALCIRDHSHSEFSQISSHNQYHHHKTIQHRKGAAAKIQQNETAGRWKRIDLQHDTTQILYNDYWTGPSTKRQRLNEPDYMG